VVFATFAFSCGGDEQQVGPAPSAAAPKPTAAPMPEATAVESRDATPGLRPADGDTPAAGICLGPTEEAVVTIELFPDIPSPRCSYATPDQRIRFVNRMDEQVTLALGRYSASVPAGAAVLFDAPAGTYLAPGVHVIDASLPSARAAIWLREAP
jgi:hypothetical protein